MKMLCIISAGILMVLVICFYLSQVDILEHVFVRDFTAVEVSESEPTQVLLWFQKNSHEPQVAKVFSCTDKVAIDDTLDPDKEPFLEYFKHQGPPWLRAGNSKATLHVHPGTKISQSRIDFSLVARLP